MGGGNALRFPRPCATLPPGPVQSAPTAGQRPPGRGGRWPGALGPRRAWGQRGAVAGAMAPALAAGLAVRILSFRPRTRATLPPRPVQPAPTEASARRWRGGRWPGALGPRRAWGHRGAVTGAMAPARMRKARAGGRFSCVPVRPPMPAALFSTLLMFAVRQKVPASQVDRTLYGLNSHEKFRLFGGNHVSDSKH